MLQGTQNNEMTTYVAKDDFPLATLYANSVSCITLPELVG